MGAREWAGEARRDALIEGDPVAVVDELLEARYMLNGVAHLRNMKEKLAKEMTKLANSMGLTADQRMVMRDALSYKAEADELTAIIGDTRYFDTSVDE